MPVLARCCAGAVLVVGGRGGYRHASVLANTLQNTSNRQIKLLSDAANAYGFSLSTQPWIVHGLKHYITSIDVGGAAAQVGLQRGDEVLQLDDVNTSLCQSSTNHVDTQNGTTSGFEMCFAPSTFGARGPNQGSQPKHQNGLIFISGHEMVVAMLQSAAKERRHVSMVINGACATGLPWGCHGVRALG